MAKNALTQKTYDTLNFVKGIEGNITLDQLAGELGVESKSLNGTLVALQRRGFVIREEAGSEVVNGKAKVIKYIRVTEAGKAYDHDAAIAADAEVAAAEAAEKAARKAAKEAEKAAKAE